MNTPDNENIQLVDHPSVPVVFYSGLLQFDHPLNYYHISLFSPSTKSTSLKVCEEFHTLDDEKPHHKPSKDFPALPACTKKRKKLNNMIHFFKCIKMTEDVLSSRNSAINFI